MASQLSETVHEKQAQREVRRSLCACRKPLSNSQNASTNLTRPAWLQLSDDGEHVTPSPLKTYQSAPAFLISSSSVERYASREGKSMSHLANVITSNRNTRFASSRRPRLHASPLRGSLASPWRRSCPPDGRIEFVYFIEKGLASTIAESTPDAAAEIGMAGREGLVGIPIVLGSDRAPYRVIVQGPGEALRVAAEDLRRIVMARRQVQDCLLLDVQAFLVQVSQTAAANARFSARQREAGPRSSGRATVSTLIPELEQEYAHLIRPVAGQ